MSDFEVERVFTFKMYSNNPFLFTILHVSQLFTILNVIILYVWKTRVNDSLLKANIILDIKLKCTS